MAFDINAEVVLSGPKNLKAISKIIKTELSSVSVDVGINVNTKSLSKVNNIQKTVKDLGRQSTTTNSSLSSLNTGVKRYTQNAKAAAAHTQKIVDQLNKTKVQAVASSKSISNLASSMSSFGKESALAIKRFGAFTVATAGAFGIFRAVQQGIGQAVKFQRELVRVGQVTGQTDKQLTGLSDTIRQLSKEYGVNSLEILGATRIIAQAGKRGKELSDIVAGLTKSKLAPTFGEIKDTAEGLIAAFNQFSIAGSKTNQVLGSINQVAKDYAVSSEEIISAIRRAGGVFAASNGQFRDPIDSLNELQAVFTSVISTTRESADTVATGLRTIFSRIQRPRVIDLLKELNIELLDSKGRFIGTFNAIKRISKEAQGLFAAGDTLAIAKLIEELGGIRQVGKLIPALTNFETTTAALKSAQKGVSEGLDKDAARASETLEKRLERLSAQFNDLVKQFTDSSSFKAVAGTFLTIAESVLTLVSALEPLIPLLTTLASIKLTNLSFEFLGGFRQGFANSGGTKGLGNRLAGGSPFTGFNNGGKVPGIGNKDTIPALLTPGEFVINREAAQKLGFSNLKSMNQTGIAKFNIGGSVGDPQSEFNAQVRQLAGIDDINKSIEEYNKAITENAELFKALSIEIQDFNTSIQIAKSKGGEGGGVPSIKKGDDLRQRRFDVQDRLDNDTSTNRPLDEKLVQVLDSLLSRLEQIEILTDQKKEASIDRSAVGRDTVSLKAEKEDLEASRSIAKNKARETLISQSPNQSSFLEASQKGEVRSGLETDLKDSNTVSNDISEKTKNASLSFENTREEIDKFVADAISNVRAVDNNIKKLEEIAKNAKATGNVDLLKEIEPEIAQQKQAKSEIQDSIKKGRSRGSVQKDLEASDAVFNEVNEKAKSSSLVFGSTGKEISKFVSDSISNLRTIDDNLIALQKAAEKARSIGNVDILPEIESRISQNKEAKLNTQQVITQAKFIGKESKATGRRNLERSNIQQDISSFDNALEQLREKAKKIQRLPSNASEVDLISSFKNEAETREKNLRSRDAINAANQKNPEGLKSPQVQKELKEKFPTSALPDVNAEITAYVRDNIKIIEGIENNIKSLEAAANKARSTGDTDLLAGIEKRIADQKKSIPIFGENVVRAQNIGKKRKQNFNTGVEKLSQIDSTPDITTTDALGKVKKINNALAVARLNFSQALEDSDAELAKSLSDRILDLENLKQDTIDNAKKTAKNRTTVAKTSKGVSEAERRASTRPDKSRPESPNGPNEPNGPNGPNDPNLKQTSGKLADSFQAILNAAVPLAFGIQQLNFTSVQNGLGSLVALTPAIVQVKTAFEELGLNSTELGKSFSSLIDNNIDSFKESFAEAGSTFKEIGGTVSDSIKRRFSKLDSGKLSSGRLGKLAGGAGKLASSATSGISNFFKNGGLGKLTAGSGLALGANAVTGFAIDTLGLRPEKETVARDIQGIKGGTAAGQGLKEAGLSGFQGAIAGAAAGSIFGPIGVAVGGLIGGLGGALQAGLSTFINQRAFNSFNTLTDSVEDASAALSEFSKLENINNADIEKVIGSISDIDINAGRANRDVAVAKTNQGILGFGRSLFGSTKFGKAEALKDSSASVSGEFNQQLFSSISSSADAFAGKLNDVEFQTFLKSSSGSFNEFNLSLQTAAKNGNGFAENLKTLLGEASGVELLSQSGTRLEQLGGSSSSQGKNFAKSFRVLQDELGGDLSKGFSETTASGQLLIDSLVAKLDVDKESKQAIKDIVQATKDRILQSQKEAAAAEAVARRTAAVRKNLDLFATAIGKLGSAADKFGSRIDNTVSNLTNAVDFQLGNTNISQQTSTNPFENIQSSTSSEIAAEISRFQTVGDDLVGADTSNNIFKGFGALATLDSKLPEILNNTVRNGGLTNQSTSEDVLNSLLKSLETETGVSSSELPPAVLQALRDGPIKALEGNRQNTTLGFSQQEFQQKLVDDDGLKEFFTGVSKQFAEAGAKLTASLNKMSPAIQEASNKLLELSSATLDSRLSFIDFGNSNQDALSKIAGKESSTSAGDTLDKKLAILLENSPVRGSSTNDLVSNLSVRRTQLRSERETAVKSLDSDKLRKVDDSLSRVDKSLKLLADPTARLADLQDKANKALARQDQALNSLSDVMKSISDGTLSEEDRQSTADFISAANGNRSFASLEEAQNVLSVLQGGGGKAGQLALQAAEADGFTKNQQRALAASISKSISSTDPNLASDSGFLTSVQEILVDRPQAEIDAANKAGKDVTKQSEEAQLALDDKDTNDKVFANAVTTFESAVQDLKDQFAKDLETVSDLRGKTVQKESNLTVKQKQDQETARNNLEEALGRKRQEATLAGGFENLPVSKRESIEENIDRTLRKAKDSGLPTDQLESSFNKFDVPLTKLRTIEDVGGFDSGLNTILNSEVAPILPQNYYGGANLEIGRGKNALTQSREAIARTVDFIPQTSDATRARINGVTAQPQNVFNTQPAPAPNDSAALSSEVVDKFAAATNQLGQIPDAISTQVGGKVEVIINGADTLANIMPQLETYIANRIGEELGKAIPKTNTAGEPTPASLT